MAIEQVPLNRLQYIRHPAIPGVELLSAESSTDSWSMFHERYLICGCPSVASSWVYRRKTHVAEDGTTAFLEPGEIHRVVTKQKPSDFLALFIEHDHFKEFGHEFGMKGVPHFRTAVAASPRLLSNLIRLRESLQLGGDALALQSRLAVLVQEASHYAECRPRIFKVAGHTRALNLVRQHLEHRFHESVTLNELATAAALSRFHLVRAFTHHFGLPPHAYQIQLRIKRACRLLRKGAPCAEVATAVGFADQSHLGRHFKKVMGTTPSTYRRSRVGWS